VRLNLTWNRRKVKLITLQNGQHHHSLLMCEHYYMQAQKVNWEIRSKRFLSIKRQKIVFCENERSCVNLQALFKYWFVRSHLKNRSEAPNWTMANERIHCYTSILLYNREEKNDEISSFFLIIHQSQNNLHLNCCKLTYVDWQQKKKRLNEII
jgi:hypothetical protein